MDWKGTKYALNSMNGSTADVEPQFVLRINDIGKKPRVHHRKLLFAKMRLICTRTSHPHRALIDYYKNAGTQRVEMG